MAEVATIVRPTDPFHLDKALTAYLSDVGNATFEPLYQQPINAPPANYGATSA